MAPIGIAFHSPILTHYLKLSMRPLRHLPQLRQIRATPSATRPAGQHSRAIRYFAGFRSSQPRRQLDLAKPPLTSNFQGRNFLAFRPKTHCSCGNAEPLGNGGSG